MVKTKKIGRKLPLNSTKGGTEAVYKVTADGKIMTGRKTKKTPELLIKLQDALMKGCTEGEACAYVGIRQQTLIERKKESKEFSEQIEHWKRMYVQALKFVSYQRAMTYANKDATEILFKIDKRYSDKHDIDVKGEISLVGIAKAMQQKRLDREKDSDL